MACPTMCPTDEAAGSDARYPLAMISPPARNFLNSTFVNVQSLRDIEAEPVLEMHPQDAQRAAFRRRGGARVQRPGHLPLQGQAEPACPARCGPRAWAFGGASWA
jgi:hypothetical protein